MGLANRTVGGTHSVYVDKGLSLRSTHHGSCAGNIYDGDEAIRGVNEAADIQ